MMPVKDTVEKLVPATAPSISQAPSANKTDTGGLRSDAVSLEVPVRVHGSRTTEAVPDTPHTVPFEEQTSTMIVFPQGGVLKMTTAVSVGQMLVVTNLKSGQDAICRVLKVRAYANTQSYVEVEFTHRQVGYWGVQFLSDPAEAPKKSAPVPATRVPVNPAAAFEAPHQPPAMPASVNRVPAAPNKAAEAAKSTSQFVGIGSQEDVQLAATPTLASRSGAAAPLDFKARAVEPSKQAAALVSPLSPLPVVPASVVSMAAPLSSAPSAVPLTSRSVEEMPGNAQPAIPEPVDSAEPVVILEDNEDPAMNGSPAPSAAPSRRTFGDSTNLAGKRAAAREMFGVPLESERVATEGESSNKLILLAGAAALLAVASAGGYFLFRQHAVTVPAQSVSPVSQGAIAPSTTLSAASQVTSAVAPNAAKSAPSRTVVPTPQSQVAPVHEQAAVDTKQPARTETPAAVEPSPAPAVAETRRPAGNVPSLFGALNAHPVASHSAAQEDQAPVIPVGAPATEADSLAVISQPAAGLPAPPASATKAPRLLSSVLPIYPDFARQRGIEGNVVVQATVEPNGTVGATKVLSGPQSLREAALHALRQWKYEPGKVDGQAAPVDVTVTLHFSGK